MTSAPHSLDCKTTTHPPTQTQTLGKSTPGDVKGRQTGDLYHEIRVGFPVVGSRVVLGDGHGVAGRGFPHLEKQPRSYRGPGEPCAEADADTFACDPKTLEGTEQAGGL